MKNSSGTVKSQRKLTMLQVSVIMIMVLLFIAWSVSSMITYGSDRRPSEDLFLNSQTVQVMQV